MLLKIKIFLREITIIKHSPDNKINLVTIISGLLRYIGLSSYTTVYKVHWTANVSTFCFLYSCISQVIALFMAKDDPERLFECFSVILFCAVGVLKLFSLRINHKGWRFLLNQISSMENEQLNGNTKSHFEYHSDSEENDDFSEYINIYTDKFKYTSTILIRIYGFTVVIFVLSPFVELVVCKLRGLECLAYPHILPGWTPLDHLTMFGYIVTVLCESIASLYCVMVHTVFDVTAIGVMMFVCGQHSLLRDYSSRIAGNGKRCNISKKRNDRARVRIAKCHDINSKLVNSVVELDKLLINILGVYFFVATVTLCTVAVRFKSEDMSKMQLFRLIQYMCGLLTQLFLFCHYGDALFNESSTNMGQGPFAAASWCISPSVRRDLTILGAGMMRPRPLRAGPFNYLKLSSFVQVVRTAYSYYAVLGTKE